MTFYLIALVLFHNITSTTITYRYSYHHHLPPPSTPYHLPHNLPPPLPPPPTYRHCQHLPSQSPQLTGITTTYPCYRHRYHHPPTATATTTRHCHHPPTTTATTIVWILTVTINRVIFDIKGPLYIKIRSNTCYYCSCVS